jgi:hypothetical protein
MNKIKLFFVGMAALVCGNVMAQKITAQNVTIAPGATADLAFSIESNSPAALAEFELALPEGLSVDQKNYDEGAIWNDGHGASVKTKKKSGNTYVLVMSQDGEEFTEASGLLITLKLSAAADMAQGEYQIKMEKINLTSLDAKQMNTVEEDVIKVTVADPTGINGLNAAENEIPAYNLAGQKVDKNYKGIVVKSGKKSLVK